MPPVPVNPVTGANLPSFTTGVLASQSNFPQNISVAQFNPALGTLTGIRIDYLTFDMANISITNNEPSATETASGTLNYQISLTSPNGTVLSNVPRANAVSGSIPAGQTLNVPGQGFYDIGVNNPAVAALWQGTSNVLFPVAFTTQNNVQVTGGDNAQQARFRGYAKVQVTYTFTPNAPPPPPAAVPEPATLTTLGVLLIGGLGFARRKLFA
jgi:hypothetical protein